MRQHYEHLRRYLLLHRRGPIFIVEAAGGSALELHDRAGAVIADRVDATIYTRV